MTDPNTLPESTGLDAAARAFAALETGTADTPKAARKAPAADEAEAKSPVEQDEEDEAQQAEESSDTTPDDEEEDEESSDDESEDDDEATDDDEDGSDEPDPLTTKVTVKIGDKTEVLTLDEVKKGYLRQSDYTRKAQTLADERKSLEGEKQVTRKDRDDYATLLTALRSKLDEFEAANREPDWNRLREANPLQYALERDAWRERQEVRNLAHQEAQRVAVEQAREQEQQLRTYAQQQRELALEANPGWKDSKTWQRDRAAMLDIGRKVGLSDAELDRASIDHRVLLLLHKAAAYERMQARASKPVRPDATAPNSPPVAKPSAKSTAPKPATEAKRAQQRLRQTGSLSDAAAVFKTLF